jgi:hypothetical protein
MRYYLDWWRTKKQVYILPKLGDYIFATIFDLWMSKGAHDIFAFVINF